MAVVPVVLALALAACGGSGDETAGDPAAPAGAASGFPVTIEHTYGMTRIPDEPARVVTVGYNDHDFALALGVTPVGVREWFGEQSSATWPWARDELSHAEPEVLSAEEISFEQVAALRPDLILGVYSGMTESDYAKLSRIAPTVAQTDEYVAFGMPWQEQTLLIGRALGREDRAEELVREVEARFARARAAHPEFRRATALFAYREAGGGFGAYASTDARGRFLRSLGFRSSGEIDELAGDQFFAQVSHERLRLIDEDVLVMIDLADVAASRAELVEDPLYRRLAAVREGRDVYPSVEVGAALSFSSPLSLPLAIDEIVPELAEATERLDRESGEE
ncbi:MAG: iron-siderophore ABC transporter substrate-binding protein [Solirubrobacterales bacterium]